MLKWVFSLFYFFKIGFVYKTNTTCPLISQWSSCLIVCKFAFLPHCKRNCRWTAKKKNCVSGSLAKKKIWRRSILVCRESKNFRNTLNPHLTHWKRYFEVESWEDIVKMRSCLITLMASSCFLSASFYFLKSVWAGPFELGSVGEPETHVLSLAMLTSKVENLGVFES